MSDPIALIGYGAIARAILAEQHRQGAPQVTQVVVRPGKADAVQADLPDGCTAIETLNALSSQTSFVLECAGHEAVRTFGVEVLSRGIDFGVISVGALAEIAVLEELKAASLRHGAKAIVLPGAIGGIDALAAAGPALEDVRYVARKPPLSWRGSPADETHDLTAIEGTTALFEGTAREAALGYPKNANVVATVALAGVGFDRTGVTLLADPGAKGNTHEITASGGGYNFQFKTSGAALPENPRTSALTARSALRAIAQRGSGVIIQRQTSRFSASPDFLLLVPPVCTPLQSGDPIPDL